MDTQRENLYQALRLGLIDWFQFLEVMRLL